MIVSISKRNGYDLILRLAFVSSMLTALSLVISYGKLWSAAEVRKVFAPSSESVEAVRDWLRSVGIDRVVESSGWLSFESTVGYVEDVLNAEYFEHEDEDEYEDHGPKTVRMGCDQYASST